MCGCGNSFSNMSGSTQSDFNSKIGIEPIKTSFSNDGENVPATNTDKTATDKPVEKTTGQQIKGAINDGTVKNAADSVGAWIETVGKGIGIFNGTTPIKSSSNSSSSGSDSTDINSSDNSLPSYVWWIIGLLLLLLVVWGIIHFSKSK